MPQAGHSCRGEISVAFYKGLCYNTLQTRQKRCRVRTSVVQRLPKPLRRVRLPYPAPRRSKRHGACSDLFYTSERAHFAAPPFQIQPAALLFDLVLGAVPEDAASILFPCSKKEGHDGVVSLFFYSASRWSLPIILHSWYTAPRGPPYTGCCCRPCR